MVCIVLETLLIHNLCCVSSLTLIKKLRAHSLLFSRKMVTRLRSEKETNSYIKEIKDTVSMK